MSQPVIATHPINGALSTSFYSINRALRGLQSFRGSCGAYLDWYGWRHEQQFAQALQQVFYDLHIAGYLGRRQGDIAYRGDWFSPERIASVRPGDVIHDAGYSFAAPSAPEALFHLHEEVMIEKGVVVDPKYPMTPVILKIIVGEASLYLPGPDDDDPLGMRDGEDFLAKLVNGQFILDRNSLLKVENISRRAPDPQHLDHHVTVIECKQVL